MNARWIFWLIFILLLAFFSYAFSEGLIVPVEENPVAGQRVPPHPYILSYPVKPSPIPRGQIPVNKPFSPPQFPGSGPVN